MVVGLTKLIYVTTAGVIAMIGINKGTVILLKKHIMNLRHMGNLIKLHCVVVHQEALCARTIYSQSLINITTRVVNNFFLISCIPFPVSYVN